MAELVITAAAEADYLEGLLWYAKRSPRAAEGFEAEFDYALQRSPRRHYDMPSATSGIADFYCGDILI